jgi:sugar phosphate isomerase/epimerase
LKEVGYEGYVSVEVFQFEEGAEVIASRSLETLQKALQEVLRQSNTREANG